MRLAEKETKYAYSPRACIGLMSRSVGGPKLTAEDLLNLIAEPGLFDSGVNGSKSTEKLRLYLVHKPMAGKFFVGSNESHVVSNRRNQTLANMVPRKLGRLEHGDRDPFTGKNRSGVGSSRTSWQANRRLNKGRNRAAGAVYLLGSSFNRLETRRREGQMWR
jgi:hypothetical protein